MGLNIVVETVGGSAHPTWDSVRRGPDRDLAMIIKSLPSIETTDFEGDPLIRPTDFALWRKAAPDEPEARSCYLKLVGILENEPDY